MDLTRLRIFVAVVDHGSFAAAADALAYTPSAVSQQIARLEAEAGVKLVERGGRGTTPTPAGVLLLRHARDILERVAQARHELDVLSGASAERLRLGAFSTAATAFAAAALRDVRSSRPDLRAALRELEPFDAVAELRDGRIDAAVVYHRDRHDLGEDFRGRRVADPRGLTASRLLSEPYVLALPPTHPLASAPVLDATALDGVPMVGNAEWPGLDTLTARLAAAGASLRFDDLISHSYATVLGLVAAGDGLALVPALAALQADDTPVRFRLLPPDLTPTRAIDLLTVSGRTSDPLTALSADLHQRAQHLTARLTTFRRTLEHPDAA